MPVAPSIILSYIDNFEWMEHCYFAIRRTASRGHLLVLPRTTLRGPPGGRNSLGTLGVRERPRDLGDAAQWITFTDAHTHSDVCTQIDTACSRAATLGARG